MLETERFPLILHVADPDFFWDADHCPDWARENGWDYSDGTFPKKSELHAEVEHVLTRFPGLVVTLAHFQFMSTDLPAAAAFLEKHPTVSFDLAPHLDMYRDFSVNSAGARAFFTAHSDRIVFGTDLDTRVLKRGNAGHQFMRSVVSLIRHFLETDGEFQQPNGRIYQGMDLPQDVLKQIYYQNFERIYSKMPAKMGESNGLTQVLF